MISIVVRYPRCFFFTLFLASSTIAIFQLQIGLHIFCDINSSSGKYIVIHEESSECEASRETPESSTILSNEIRENLCRGTYAILDTLSRSIPNLLVSRWILPPVTIRPTCAAPPEKKKSGIQSVIKGINGIFKRGKKKGGNVNKVLSDNDWTKDVSSPLEFKLSSGQSKIINSMRVDFQNRLLEEPSGRDSFIEQMEQVRWGGSTERSSSWWYPDGKNGGTSLMITYMKIMKWPEDSTTIFPFNAPCTKGCPVDFALTHTLEFRTKFKPWLNTPSAYRANENGLMYVHGYSPTKHYDKASQAGYSLVWYTLANYRKSSGNEDYEDYIRVVVNAVDTCVANALYRSNNKIGKCNIVLDCDGFGMSMNPPMRATRKLLKMLQDHYPDRLGVIVILNMASTAQMVYKIVAPFIPDVVRRKIHIIPNKKEEQYGMLKKLIDEKYIPIKYGGTDDFKFDSNAYYNHGVYKTDAWSETEGKEYIQSMPYHA